jgi:hypothetical protein
VLTKVKHIRFTTQFFSVRATVWIYFKKILWHIDPLLGKDLETKNEITAVAMQQGSKQASIKIVIVGNGVFYSAR